MTPVCRTNCCGVLKVSEAEIRSAARRRVRKSRGEQEGRKNNVISAMVFRKSPPFDRLRAGFLAPRTREKWGTRPLILETARVGVFCIGLVDSTSTAPGFAWRTDEGVRPHTSQKLKTSRVNDL